MAGARKAQGAGAPASAPLAIARRGLMLVLSSPSGAGKTTLSRMLLEGRQVGRAVGVGDDAAAARRREATAATIISSRSRDSRRWSRTGELLEWAEVFGNFYGTPRAPVERALAAGRDVLFDIDWQGTQQLREKVEADVATIFVLPPSTADLERRLRTRAQDSDAVIASRMAKAADEMSHWAEYDYVVINNDIDQAFAEVRAILAAERLKRERQTGLSAFVRDLQAKL